MSEGHLKGLSDIDIFGHSIVDLWSKSYDCSKVAM